MLNAALNFNLGFTVKFRKIAKETNYDIFIIKIKKEILR